MINMNELDDIINEATDQKPEETPKWTQYDKNALACYEAINTLKARKAEYIKSVKDIAELQSKKSAKITKTEVAGLVEPTAQYLFRVSSFASHALKLFDDVNNYLEALKNKRLNPTSNGLVAMKKEGLVKKAQDQTTEIKRLEQKLAEQTIDNILSSLPESVLTKLNVK
jgi:hypothetical protein